MPGVVPGTGPAEKGNPNVASGVFYCEAPA